MALVPHLESQYLEFVASLYNEELLDEQFALVKNSTLNNPAFDSATMERTFFKDSETLINSLAQTLEQPVVNLRMVYKLSQHLKGSSSTFGASKIKKICAEFDTLCKNYNNVQMLKQKVHQLRYERLRLKTELDALRGIENAIVAAGGATPVVELQWKVRQRRA